MSKRTQGLRVLMVEHESVDVELNLAELTRAGFAVEAQIAATPAQFAACLDRAQFDVVLADYRLPQWTGMDALHALRARGLDTPLILVTGTMGDERAVESVKQGAADYILKGNLSRLPLAVTRALESVRQQREQAASDRLIRMLRLAVDQSPAAVIITDTAGTIEYLNERFTEITGYPPTEVIGKNPRLLQSGQTPLATYQELWGRLGDGRTWSGELRNRRRTGELYWARMTISPIRDPSGTVTHFLATQEDVSERKQAEEALRATERRLRNLFETVNLIVLVLDTDARIEYVNPFFLGLTGYAREEAFGSNWFELVIPGDQASQLTRVFRELLEQERHAHHRNAILTKAGQPRMIAWHNTVLRDAQGRPTGTLSIGEDVTEHARLEEQYRHAQKMEAVGRLAGGVAHDFNNLLTVIRSYAELVHADLPADDPHRADLEPIIKAAEGAAGLTRQLLSFSRQEVIQPRVLALNEVVTRSEKLLRRVIGEDITLHTRLDPAPLLVTVDPGQLEQIIMNLAVNARDAMPQGGKLTIETGPADFDEELARRHWPATAGRFALLAMSDTGVGMDEVTRSQIFEPFFTTKEAGKGTGLGLATVYGIVKQHGGFIWVYSEPGQGTTFKIYFPLVEGEADLAASPAPHSEARRGTEVVLIAEDAAALRAVARQTLERYGYTVLEAPDGQSALDLAAKRTGPIHLLLTDVVMPEMGGRRLAERFRALRPETRVLFMSGYTDDTITRHGVLESGIAYLQKPFTPDALAGKVREVLDAPAGG